MNAWTIYLLLKLDALQALFGITATTLIVILVILSIVFGVLSSDMHRSVGEELFFQYLKSKLFKYWSITFFCLLICTFIPTTKQMCAIYLIPKIANNEQIQNMGDKSLTIIEKKFEEWVNDMTKKEIVNKK